MLPLSTNNLLIRAITLVGGGALLLSTLGLAEAKAQATATVERSHKQLPDAQLLAQQ